MDVFIFTVLVFTSAGGLASKHVFVPQHRSWLSAQQHCRTHYTDLSPLTNSVERRVFRKSVDESRSGWLGLYWSVTDLKWKWSGGADAENQDTLTYWLDVLEGVLWKEDKWYPNSLTSAKSFFCLNLIVVQEEKTWEEALEHCRENHNDFTSLLSETENLLATTQIQNSTITQRVWVGLRFLGDAWMWANGDPLKFQAGTQTGDPDLRCPVWKRCGALTKQGEWENRDCQEKLHFICV